MNDGAVPQRLPAVGRSTAADAARARTREDRPMDTDDDRRYVLVDGRFDRVPPRS